VYRWLDSHLTKRVAPLQVRSLEIGRDKEPEGSRDMSVQSRWRDLS
jgi:hypothetical protein